MATTINKPVVRETHDTVDHKGKPKAVIVTLERDAIGLRLKGARSRDEVWIPYGKLYKKLETETAMRGAGLIK